MNQPISFQVTPIDPAPLCLQVSQALEKRIELISRQKCPKLWELTDKLNSVEKTPQAIRENRRKRRGFLGFFQWVLALLLLAPGLVEPQKLSFPLLVGTACLGVGTVILWWNKRTLLGILGLIQGALVCLGALSRPAELGMLLPLGIVYAAIGLAALLTRKHANVTPFDRAAQNLLQSQASRNGMEQVQVLFSQDGMTIRREEASKTYPYSSLEFVLETDDLLLPILGDAMSILQKKDLLTGTIPELREWLGQQTQYVNLSAKAE